MFVLGTDFLNEDDAYFRSCESQNLEAIKREPMIFLNETHNVLMARPLATRLGLALHDTIPLATGTGVAQFHVRGFPEGEGGWGEGNSI